MASFYGKTLDEFYKSDYDYFRGDNNKGGGFGRKPYDEITSDIISGGGPRSAVFRDLRSAGVPREKYNFYADKAGIKNVNSDNDIKDIIAAYEADISRSDGNSSDSEMKEKEKKPVVFADSEEDKRIDANRPYLDRIAKNNRRGISNYVFGSKNPRQNVFNDDGSVKSDNDDMRDSSKDEESMDFVNRYKAKLINQINRYDRAMG